ncbi:MAG: phage integrase SAM-like domain-containing protein, partial [Nitrosopumilus sp.]
MNKKKNVGTASNYKSAINNFENFCMEKHGQADLIEELKEYSDIEILDFIQAWIDWNDRLNPSTVINMFSRIKKY